MNRALWTLVLLLFTPLAAFPDGGVLIPRDKTQPDPSILSLEEMEITIQIDNGDARVFVRQIFANHTVGIQEGNYVFALPSRATVSDFAVWDGPVRIPAVILERKRAGEIYNELKQQSIDPGLLQLGERDAENAKRSAIFSARIVPIPAYGTKRLEFEYHETIPVENLKSYFAIPLRPDAYQAQAARHFRINFELKSAHTIANFQTSAKSYSLKLEEKSAHAVKGIFDGENVNLTEDFVATFELDKSGSDTLAILTHRNPSSGQPSPTETAPVRNTNEPGFFAADALLGTGQTGNQAARNPNGIPGTAKTILILFDTSLSMQWEKLERSYQAMETLLRTIKPTDKFNVILFNSQVQTFQPSPIPADSAAVQRALDFVRASRLRGGTSLQKALQEALQESKTSNGNSYLVLLSDGESTEGVIRNAKLATWYETEWKNLSEANRPRTYIFGVGDDANLPLFKLLARQDGVLENVLSTEPLDFKLNSFLSKIGRSPLGQLGLSVSPDATVDSVYPLQDAAFTGSRAVWVGRFQKPAQDVSFTLHGVRDGTPLAITAKANLPRESNDHPQLPRLWARARVDALLEKIERDGEDQASIDEIIRLSRQYKFVTPYTSFLAAPRALLRPRVIRPGDPIIRVKTDSSITSVIALFPFGLVKKLKYLSGEDTWQTRFFAPTDLQDGTYPVRFVMRDRAGQTYNESKTFVIASKSPVVQIKLSKKRFHRGELLDLKVSASQNTRTLVARLEGAAPVNLKWDTKTGANTGALAIPEQMIPGTYILTVTAEDIAHNMGSQGVEIEIVP
ncbi:MAG TPA: VIT and VWA domain-containing protein [Candidatus Dormibacteraeota bacterium]|jgi:Ca-activated chloride channel family protein|nr:VIT and VWA domain-containing protein [Candidatus Dormibacteraeota bacterium]